MPTEIDKLLAARTIGLPPDLFVDVAPNVVAGRRLRWGRLPTCGRSRWH
ncbi:hypothetical protein [Streptomyces sp. NPDC092307]